MKNKIIKYTIPGSENKLNKIIRDEIKCETIDKKYNITGEGSIFGGIDIYNHIYLGYEMPSTNPLIRLNLKLINADDDDIKKFIRLKRVNGRPYDSHRAIAIVLATIMAIIASYQILNYGFKENIAYSILPIFGIVYFLIVELIARITYKSLCKKVETIMRNEGITYHKL